MLLWAKCLVRLSDLAQLALNTAHLFWAMADNLRLSRAQDTSETRRPCTRSGSGQGTAARCRSGCGVITGSSLAVEGLAWGQTGPFAVNMWIKQMNNSGSMFQYLLSTRSRALGNITDDNIFYPNQVG